MSNDITLTQEQAKEANFETLMAYLRQENKDPFVAMHAEDRIKRICYRFTGSAGINPEQIPSMLEELKELRELKSNFYMNICRAYNAGKQSMNNQHQDAREKGKEAFSERFVSSHDYFLNSFPTFKTNVP